MIGENATTIVPGILCVSGFLTWVLCRAASLKADAEDRLARTLVYRHCMSCAYEWDHKVIEDEQDLGRVHVIEETCLACQYHAGRTFELDLDKLTPEKIRAAFNTEEEKTCRI